MCFHDRLIFLMDKLCVNDTYSFIKVVFNTISYTYIIVYMSSFSIISFPKYDGSYMQLGIHKEKVGMTDMQNY